MRVFRRTLETASVACRDVVRSEHTEAELRALADEAEERFGAASGGEVLAWAAETFGAGLVVASSMADTHLVHLAQAAAPGVDVLFLDTGYHFAETIGTRDAVAAVYDVNLLSITPRRTVAEQDAEYGPKLHDRDPERCCALRKVEPLERGLAPAASGRSVRL